MKACKLISAVVLLCSCPALVLAAWTDGLVGYWSFNNPANPCYDDSGNGHNGTPIGGIAYIESGLSGGSLFFDGTDDYISIPSDPNFSTGTNGSFTFSAYIQADNYVTKQVILSRRAPCNNEGYFSIYVQNQRIYLSFYHNDSNPSNAETHIIHSDAILQNGQAYRIFWQRTWGQLGTQLFLNGIERLVRDDTSCMGTTYPGNWDFPVFIGAQNGTGETCDITPAPNFFFAGLIDEVTVWNRILSVEEMEAFSGQEFYPFEDAQEFILTNDYSQLTFNSFGFIQSLQYEGIEQL